jgi:hypothetical protein
MWRLAGTWRGCFCNPFSGCIKDNREIDLRWKYVFFLNASFLVAKRVLLPFKNMLIIVNIYQKMALIYNYNGVLFTLF